MKHDGNKHRTSELFSAAVHVVSSVIKAPDQQHMQQTLLNSLPDNKASNQIDPALEIRKIPELF